MKASTGTAYRPRLDEVWTIFGPDRLIHGSDWPNSDLMNSNDWLLDLAAVSTIIEDHVADVPSVGKRERLLSASVFVRCGPFRASA